MKKVALLILLVMLLSFAEEKKGPIMEKAMVLSQELIGRDGNNIHIPPSLLAHGSPRPLLSRLPMTNILRVRLENQELTLREEGTLVLLCRINDTFQFYRDGDVLIMTDTERRKHNFSVVHYVHGPAFKTAAIVIALILLGLVTLMIVISLALRAGSPLIFPGSLDWVGLR